MKRTKQSGFSLIEALLVSSILLTVSLALGTLIVQMQSASRQATRNFESLELRASVAKTLSNLPLCSCVLGLNSQPFDSGNSASGSVVSKITADCGATSQTVIAADAEVPGSTTQLSVSRMVIGNIRALTGPNEYSGTLRVGYKNDLRSSVPLRPFELEIRFLADPSSPAGAKRLQTCTYVSGGSGTLGPATAPSLGRCPAGMVITGIGEAGIECGSLASVTPPNPSAPFSLDNPGIGCTGAGCTSSDFGSCTGERCRTNGNYCSGSRCIASGDAATCSGARCCAGPSCQ